MKKIIFIFAGIFAIVCSIGAVVSAVESGNILSPPNIIINDNFLNLVTSEQIIHYECGGCSERGKCFVLGSRIGIYKYCNFEAKFVLQKKTGEDCENNFECQSNKCAGKCEHKEGIEIIEIYSGEDTVVKNLFLKQGVFYFQGLHDTQEISLIKIGNNPELLFGTNEGLHNITKEVIYSTPTSQFILEGGGILMEDSVSKINITFIESKTPFNDSKKLIEELTCKGLFVNEECREEGESFEMDGEEYYIEGTALRSGTNEKILNESENLSLKDSTSITGAVVEGERKGFVSNFLNWIKRILN